MKGLPEKLKRKKLLQLIRKVTGPVEKAAKLEVQMIERRAWTEEGRATTGNLEASIGRIRGKSKEFPNIQVAPRAKGKFQGGHGHLVHFGTKKRYGSARRGLSGRYYRGAVKPNPYMKRAFDKTFNQSRAQFEKDMARYLQQELNKLEKMRANGVS
ncbi:hypothetical protein DN752_19645 [Echinicola strongylocentroti]|uniref:HK97 gp10 family phage protein n=2 Tax=Echinicola strongylocentroti TaxID=1795355 RepID=A0A2Z4INQ2_9BACT|nr:hypothetical protein DN752_19645 [Echinicola strongylocentroti]